MYIARLEVLMVLSQEIMQLYQSHPKSVLYISASIDVKTNLQLWPQIPVMDVSEITP